MPTCSTIDTVVCGGCQGVSDPVRGKRLPLDPEVLLDALPWKSPVLMSSSRVQRLLDRYRAWSTLPSFWPVVLYLNHHKSYYHKDNWRRIRQASVTSAALYMHAKPLLLGSYLLRRVSCRRLCCEAPLRRAVNNNHTSKFIFLISHSAP